MSLTTKDLHAIRLIVRQEVKAEVATQFDEKLEKKLDEKFDEKLAKFPTRSEVKQIVQIAIKPLRGEIKALRNDIAEIYHLPTIKREIMG